MFDMELLVYPVVLGCAYICCLKHVVYIGGVCKWFMFILCAWLELVSRLPERYLF